MDSYPVTDALLDWLDRKGMRGNGLAGPALHVNSAEKGRGDGLPRQFQGGNNVRQGEDKTPRTQEPSSGQMPRPVMANAMSRGAWRVVRSAPLLMVLDCEHQRHG